jgi:hypothetical protein
MINYKGFISFNNNEKEFRRKVDRFFEWCSANGLDLEDDENWNSYCESRNSI